MNHEEHLMGHGAWLWLKAEFRSSIPQLFKQIAPQTQQLSLKPMSSSFGLRIDGRPTNGKPRTLIGPSMVHGHTRTPGCLDLRLPPHCVTLSVWKICSASDIDFLNISFSLIKINPLCSIGCESAPSISV